MTLETQHYYYAILLTNSVLQTLTVYKHWLSIVYYFYREKLFFSSATVEDNVVLEGKVILSYIAKKTVPQSQNDFGVINSMSLYVFMKTQVTKSNTILKFS